MTGRNHIVMNFISLGFGLDTLFLASKNKEVPDELIEKICDFLSNGYTNSISIPINTETSQYIFLCVLAFIFGSLLPDIDSKYSILGKYFYLPIEHRTWTHAIYIPIILFIQGIKYRYVFWIGLGVFLHDFWDSFSKSGINWLYPIKNKHHLCKFYYTSKISEFIFVFTFAFLLVFYTFFLLFQHGA